MEWDHIQGPLEHFRGCHLDEVIHHCFRVFLWCASWDFVIHVMPLVNHSSKILLACCSKILHFVCQSCATLRLLLFLIAFSRLLHILCSLFFKLKCSGSVQFVSGCCMGVESGCGMVPAMGWFEARVGLLYRAPWASCRRRWPSFAIATRIPHSLSFAILLRWSALPVITLCPSPTQVGSFYGWGLCFWVLLWFYLPTLL